ncbi:PREDICTED: uncharacterized protein LOC108370017 [Rhagoletis zephyria]|uniref:uncharacterized protein LOC108370017 n=1 Tax=Rhagoletis zephyria TaxID=28612 RepID=UPI0008116C42|nr:PREDICTED: uncharacterized protein LOC108370017 [Rhagoletis zephyria]
MKAIKYIGPGTVLLMLRRHHIRNCVYYDSDLQEVEVLKVEVETFKRVNAHLKKETEKQCTELATLKRESDLQLRRHAWKMESLQKRLDEMAAQMKNVEDALASIFTKGQIAKLKSGSKATKMGRRGYCEVNIVVCCQS